MLIVQRGDQKIDYPVMIGWGVVFLILFGGLVFLTANVVMRSQLESKLSKKPKVGQGHQTEARDDYWSRG